jgi:outer membrane protein FlgP
LGKNVLNVGKPSRHFAFSQQATSKALKLLQLKPNQRVKDFKSPSNKEQNMKRMTSLCLAIGLVALTGCKSVDLAMLSPNTKDQNAMVSPLIEKRETITATGYAVVAVQNHRNPAQQRLMAIRASKLDAYRNLTEQVYGQQLDSSTTVADMVVTNDTFRTKVEGVIYGARLVSITPVGDDTYETTLSLDKDVVQDLRILFMGQMVSKGR